MNRVLISILLIGHKSSKVSGSALSFTKLYDNINLTKTVKLVLINTARSNKNVNNIFINFIVGVKVCLQIIFNLRHVDVCSYHASAKGFIKFGPIIVVLVKLFRKPIILRLFGGGQEIVKNTKRRSLDNYLLSQTKKADKIFVQTKYLVKYFEQLGFLNIDWLPTSRKYIEGMGINIHPNKSCNNFIFLGRIIEEKGILTILDSVKYLTDGVNIDLWGSLDGNLSRDFINNHGRGIVRYRGEIPSEKVPDKLREYDALLLPTFYEGEGYPGVIIESFMQGIPVITTNWLSIPEIIDDDTGILIPIKSPEALGRAINKISSNIKCYHKLKKGATSKGKMFSEIYWHNYFINQCYNCI